MRRRPHGSVPVEEAQNLPGCGMAAYAVLLILFLVAGVTGMTLATLQVLQAGEEAGPTKLRPGSQVAVWQMAPLRQASVVDIDEVPLAWHDASRMQDGSRACALMEDRLVSVEEEVGRSLPYARISTLDYSGSPEEGSVVTASGANPQGDPVTIRCEFFPHDGGTRMLKQLEVERERAQSAAPDAPELNVSTGDPAPPAAP